MGNIRWKTGRDPKLRAPKGGKKSISSIYCPSTDGEEKETSSVEGALEQDGLDASHRRGREWMSPGRWFETLARAQDQVLELGNSRPQWNPFTENKSGVEKLMRFLSWFAKGMW